MVSGRAILTYQMYYAMFLKTTSSTQGILNSQYLAFGRKNSHTQDITSTFSEINLNVVSG